MKQLTPQALRKMNFLISAVYLVQAVILVLISNSNSLPINTSFLASDAIASKLAGHSVVAPAIHTLFNVNVSTLLALILLISACIHLLTASRYRSSYEAGLKKGYNKTRWIEMAVSGGLMFGSVSLISGVYDLASQVMIIGLIALAAIMGLLTETSNAGAKKPNWTHYRLAVTAGLLPVVGLGLYTLNSIVYGYGVATYLYFVYATIILGFGAGLVNLCWQFKKNGRWANYLFVDEVYSAIGFITKSAIVWQIFFGILR